MRLGSLPWESAMTQNGPTGGHASDGNGKSAAKPHSAAHWQSLKPRNNNRIEMDDVDLDGERPSKSNQVIRRLQAALRSMGGEEGCRRARIPSRELSVARG